MAEFYINQTNYIAKLNELATRTSRTLFSRSVDAGNTGTGEDNLYVDTTTGVDCFLVNGDAVAILYGGTFVGSTSDKRLRLYTYDTLIYDSGALAIASAAGWELRAWVVRASPSELRCVASLAVGGLTTIPPIVYTSIVGSPPGVSLPEPVTFRLTGEASGTGPATNDLVARLGSIRHVPTAT